MEKVRARPAIGQSLLAANLPSICKIYKKAGRNEEVLFFYVVE